MKHDFKDQHKMHAGSLAKPEEDYYYPRLHLDGLEIDDFPESGEAKVTFKLCSRREDMDSDTMSVELKILSIDIKGGPAAKKMDNDDTGAELDRLMEETEDEGEEED